MKAILMMICSVLLVLGNGCTTMQNVDSHTSFDLATQPTIYRDQWVRASALEVHVQPRSQAVSAPNVLFLPFRVTQPMDNPGDVGYAVARTVYQTWLTMQIFPALEFSGDNTPYRRDRAVQLAKVRGADMVVGGFVTYIYAGGSAGDTQIAIQVEAHDVRTGQLVWSMAQSGLIPSSSTHDYLLFAVKERLPSDPVHAITQTLAVHMGKKLQDWITPLPASNKNQDERLSDAIFSPRDPQPQARPAGQVQEEKSF